jgi:hypothetical protein
MSTTAKVFMTIVLVGTLFIPAVGELLAIPVVTALGYIWTFAPTS